MDLKEPNELDKSLLQKDLEDPKEVVEVTLVTAAPPQWEKDTKISWLVLAASFCIQAIIFGLVLCFGIYFVTLIDHFQTTKSSVALVGSIAYGTMCLCSLLSSILVRRYGCRSVVMVGGLISAVGCLLSSFAYDLAHLYLTYGLINGLGLGLAFTPTVAVLPDYFHRYRFFATAFASVGSATGTLIFQPIFLTLMKAFTWRGSMLINAGIALHITLFGALLRSRTPPSSAGWRSVVQLGLLKEAPFLLLLCNGFLWGGGVYITFSLSNALVITHGLSKAESAGVASCIGLCNVVGRVCSSVLGHREGANRPLLYAVFTLVFSIAILAATFVQTFWAFAGCLGLFGACFGGMLSQMPGVLMDLFGLPRLVTSIGYMMFAIGLGGLSLPFAAGYIGDLASLEGSFYLAHVCGVLAFVFALATILTHSRTPQST